MNKKEVKIFCCDFETTVYEGQTSTEVWSSACVELYTENVMVFGDIQKQLNFFIEQKCDIIAYYHNLKFDGNFWLSFLLKKLKLNQAFNEKTQRFIDNNKMPNNTFKYLISSMGQWYNIIIKINDFIIELRDSYKLLPFSIKRIGESFDTKHKKLDMNYYGYRYANCPISNEEMEYIKNDVLVMKEALEICFNEGHTGVTIGSCCLREFKKTLCNDKKYINTLFPQLYDIKIDKSIYGEENAGEYIRNSYKGGWCYLVKGKENKIYNNGVTYDVNSLYPSMMSSESGNYYPIGKPTFWQGNIPDICFSSDKYFFVRLRTRFKIKDNYLPFIQAKGNFLYKQNENLTTSDIIDENGKLCSWYIDIDGIKRPAKMELTLTQTDYQLFIEHYDLYDTEFLDGCYFECEIGLFDLYINKYKLQKQTSKGARRELAKLFLNNLYGKLATSTNSSFKVAYIDDDNLVNFKTVIANEKNGGYIACGSAITSYARNFTIRAAQSNYYGIKKRGFIYADTDSLHLDLNENEVKNIDIHDSEFCCWKLENKWSEGIFVRQKTYIEVIEKDNEKIYDIKCAGMNEKCKELFTKSITQNYIENDYNEKELNFIKTKRTLSDFKQGLEIPAKLLPKRIDGGVILLDTTYKLR